MTLATAVLLALFVASVPGGPATTGPSELRPAPAGSAPATAAAPVQEALQASARRVADLWERGDAQGLGEMLCPGGVALDLGERSHASLPVRQAVAAIRDLLGRHASRSVSLARVSAVAGTPSRAYVEIGWETVPEGTSEVIRHTVFVGLERTDGRWWIMEIRVLS